MTIKDHVYKICPELSESDRKILKDFENKNKAMMKWETSRLSDRKYFREARNQTSAFIKSASFRNREEVIRVLNDFFGWFEEEWRQVTDDERFCLPEYAPYELDIKLLKFLQSGEDEDKVLQRDEKIAQHFSMSLTKISEHLSKLKQGIDILGHHVSIKLRHGKNTYDSTIHPVFMTLNLTEVYFLTVILKKSFPENYRIYGEIVNGITNDIYSQLSDYAKAIIDEKAEKADVHFDQNPEWYQCYREESWRWGYFLKGRCSCKVDYMDWEDEPKICRTLSADSRGILVQIKETGEEIFLDYTKIINISPEYGHSDQI